MTVMRHIQDTYPGPGTVISRLDRLYASAVNRHPHFYRGWGDVALLTRVIDGHVSLPRGIPRGIIWEKEVQNGNCSVRRGQFLSPAADVGLPAESRQAYVEWIMPREADYSTPIVLHFAATGDEGFGRRRRAFALPLIRMGIGSLILENPYYGRRRPVGQERNALPCVSDLWKMGLAATIEGLAISAWFMDEGYQTQVACGVSMGGHIAAKVAAFTDMTLGCVAYVAPHSAEAVYLEGQLRRFVAWDVLRKEAPGTWSAEDFFRAVLARTDICHCPHPRHMKGVTIVGARNDAYIPPRSVLLLHRHWPEARLQWIRGGHVGSVLFHRRSFLAEIARVIGEITK